MTLKLRLFVTALARFAMSHSRLSILGVILAALAYGGCANSPFGAKSPPSHTRISSQQQTDAVATQNNLSTGPDSHPAPAATSVSSTRIASIDESRKTAEHVTYPPVYSPANEPTPIDSNSSRFSPAASPATAEQLTELDLQELDRALNSPNSELPQQYQTYLRAQLSAIIDRVPPRLAEDTAPIDRRSPDALAPVQKVPTNAENTAPPGVSLASHEDALLHPIVPKSAEPAADSAAARLHTELPRDDDAAVKTNNKTAALSMPKKDAATQATTAKPTEEVRKGEWREHLIRTLDALERELARYTPSDREGMQLATSARLLHLVANQREKAVAAMDQLSEDEREYWKHQIHALLIALDAENKHAGSRRAALALREIDEAADYLANMSTLDVRNLAFCEDVKSFGVYTPVKSVVFKAGQPILLYVELYNFTVHQTGNKYETKFQAEYNIVDGTGGRINKKLNPVEESEGRNRRHDFFISYQLELPKDLRPGPYTLELVIEDVIGQKSSEASIDFRVR